ESAGRPRPRQWRAQDRRPWQAGAVPASQGFQRLPGGAGTGMTLTGAVVLHAVLWFLTFYIVLQVRTRTQAESGQEVVPGTPPGALAVEDVGRSAKIATLYATLVWAVVAGIIMSGWITLEDIDFFDRLGFHKVD